LVVYKGILNCGNLSTPITANSILPVNTQGWNFVGNPYPSAIDWETVTLTGLNPTIYRWNPAQENYQVYQQGGISLNGGNSIIMPAEGFFTKALENTDASLSFTNLNRVHAAFVPVKQSKVTSDALVLNVTGENSFTDEMMIRYDALSNAEYEDNLDAVKKLSDSDNAPQIYSETGGGVKLAINAMPDPTISQQSLIIGFESQTAGNYTINVVQNLLPTSSVNLKDKETENIYDLMTTTTIPFTHNLLNSPDRFVLYFNGVTKIGDIATNDISIYVRSGILEIGNIKESTEITIYDVTGKTVIQKRINSDLSIELPQTQGIYLVKLQQGNIEFTKKIFNNQK
jgi:hypothetical protein